MLSTRHRAGNALSGLPPPKNAKANSDPSLLSPHRGKAALGPQAASLGMALTWGIGLQTCLPDSFYFFSGFLAK